LIWIINIPIVIRKKQEAAMKKFIISVSPNNLPLAVWDNPKKNKICPYMTWIKPKRRNKIAITAELHAIKFDNLKNVFIT